MEKLTLTKDNLFFTIQGEGRFVGTPSVFIRLSTCNLRCAWKEKNGSVTKCDTPYSSFEPEVLVRSLPDIIAEVKKYNCSHVVITGGEPFLQKGVVELINQLQVKGHFCTVETNGTIYLPTTASFLSLSPKLKSSTTLQDFPERINIHALSSFINHHDYQLKFVAHQPDDLLEIKELLPKINAHPAKVWLMAQGLSASEIDERAPWIIDGCKKYGWNYADRLHIRLWGNKRGV